MLLLSQQLHQSCFVHSVYQMPSEFSSCHTHLTPTSTCSPVSHSTITLSVFIPAHLHLLLAKSIPEPEPLSVPVCLPACLPLPFTFPIPVHLWILDYFVLDLLPLPVSLCVIIFSNKLLNCSFLPSHLHLSPPFSCCLCCLVYTHIYIYRQQSTIKLILLLYFT